eukprot:TRINITY_DN2919_c0_g1_i4.p1 TRINITY_DN2919_c0_g1~~TRINITY_DN2919_c0_g1_i4.p1  ORF type:complete len:181 (+),score=16.12 TRINITY_DN2919_c0_g1_i4:337-879(+)
MKLTATFRIFVAILLINITFARECDVMCLPEGYFLDAEVCACIPCPPGCDICTGPNRQNCLAPKAAQEPLELHTDLPDSPVADSEAVKIDDGARITCRMMCPPGSYITPPCTCKPCISWCERCNGPEASNCFKAQRPAQCFAPCKPGAFQAYPCVCILCAEGCSRCHGPRKEDCLNEQRG